jgi:hypothetical protein
MGKGKLSARRMRAIPSKAKGAQWSPIKFSKEHLSITILKRFQDEAPKILAMHYK